MRRGARPARAIMAVLTLALATAALADVAPPDVSYDNFPYNGGFTFARIRFRPTVWGPGPFYWGWDLKWNHDYPWAEQNFMRILQELTAIEPTVGGGNILAADDPELFDYPVAYLCEPGFWNPTESEATALRDYLHKGGFLIIDDFSDPYLQGPQWRNFEHAIERVLPEGRLMRLDVSNPVFQTFFRTESLDFTHPKLPYLETEFFGIFEDNDPTGRLLVIANYNNDIGDYWEWSDQPDSWYPVDLTQKGFRIGVNYILYGLVY